MRPVLIYAQEGFLPRGVEDLTAGVGLAVDHDSLVAAGQALTWRSTFTVGSIIAVPLTETSAVIVDFGGERGPERWSDRFARGLGHRLAGELTIASVTAGLLVGAAMGDAAEDAKLLGSAIDGLTGLLTDLEHIWMPEETAERIVADTVQTHLALLGSVADQRVSVRPRGDFTVHSVRSLSGELGRADLERVRPRVGLPWPARAGDGVGGDLGLARWCKAMQVRGHQMWCRLEDDKALVTDLWLRNRPEERYSRTRSG
ncbi:hypothetical protein OG417_51075 [Actinoallomurus sp. NBC_01490]|jgi:hypothetical protein|uniref:hypothetical protein n=1 Tax=Actinoallomurus sp. NBC_01490 TaxID=2903557 RepID=UPI002E30166C|nr:hypothetical protein [Actinoallomurus sp. NBC_01490]